MGKTLDLVLEYLQSKQSAVPEHDEPNGGHSYRLAHYHLKYSTLEWSTDSDAREVLRVLFYAIPYIGYPILTHMVLLRSPALEDRLLAALLLFINPETTDINDININIIDCLTDEQVDIVAQRLLAATREAE